MAPPIRRTVRKTTIFALKPELIAEGEAKGELIYAAALFDEWRLGGLVAEPVVSAKCADTDGVCDPHHRESADAIREQSGFGASQSISQVGSQVVGRSLNIQPTITIRPGFPVNVLVTRDLVIEPYKA